MREGKLENSHQYFQKHKAGSTSRAEETNLSDLTDYQGDKHSSEKLP
jgi:hypothetical protein